MRVRRVILRNVKNFRNFDHSFEDEWTGQIPRSLLLMGPNGSGKTTLLDAIAGAWFDFLAALADFSDPDYAPYLTSFPGKPEPVRTPHYLLAVEFLDLDRLPVWLVIVHSEQAWDDSPVLLQERAAHRIGMVRYPETGPQSLPRRGPQAFYAPPGATRFKPVAEDTTGWLDRWWQRYQDNRFGKRADLPTLIYLESENRVLLPLTEPFEAQPEVEEYQGLVRYQPTEHRKGSLQNYLVYLKVVDEDRFNHITGQINRFLVGKRLTGFDRRTGNLMIETDDGDRHPVHLLSSGEKQVLLMIAMISRWLRPGGMVLIDEPDLHLHVSWTTAMVNHLRRMVAEQDGQLIIASHEPKLWDLFTESRKVRLGDLAEVRR